MKKTTSRDKLPYMMMQDGSVDDASKQAYLTEALFMEYTAFYIINLTEDKVVAGHISEAVKEIRSILSTKLSYTAMYTMFVQSHVAQEDQRRMLEIMRIRHIRTELAHSRSFARTFLRDYNGQERYTEVIIRKLQDETPGVSPFLIFMAFRENDEEIRARMESASAEIETIHGALGSGSWKMEFNRAGDVVSCHWSDNFRHMLGYKNKEDFPDEFRSVVRIWQITERDEVIKNFWEMVHDVTGHATYDFIHRMQTKDRGIRWFRAVARIIRRKDGSPMTLHGAFMDIDNDIRLRQQLEKQKETLEKQKKALEEQTKALGKALELTQEANKAKAAFLANMSHDVRTPMNAIIGYTTMADTHLEDKTRVHDCLQKIERAGEHLLTLINEVLDMSRVDSGKLQLELRGASLQKTLHSVGEIVHPLATEHQLDIVLEIKQLEHELVFMDVGKVERILLNLISNAIKFTKPGGRISVSLAEQEHADQTESNWYCIRIQDTGVGISKEFLPHLFEPFERESNSTISRIEGSGLGLSIAEHLIKMMHGSITVDSVQGQGTTFTVRLPLTQARIADLNPAGTEPADAGGTPELPQLESRFHGARILLAEDITYNREIAQDILEEAGFKVETAENGHEAWEAVRTNGAKYYDLILMDIQMPVMNGYQATEAIRLLDGCSKEELPVLALSANAFEEDRLQSLAHGMNEHISKPIRVKQIIAELEKALLRRKGTQ